MGLLLWRRSLTCRAQIGSGLSLLSSLLLALVSVMLLASSLVSDGGCAGAVQRSSSLLFRLSPLCVGVAGSGVTIGVGVDGVRGGVGVVVAFGSGCRKYGLNCWKLPCIGWKSASLSYSSSLWLWLALSVSESEKTAAAAAFRADS